MCGGGGGGGGRDRRAEREAQERADKRAEENRQFAIEQAAEQQRIQKAAQDRFDAMMAQSALDRAEETRIAQERFDKQAEENRIERERIANLKPVAGRQGMASNLSIPQAPGDFAPPPNPGTGTSKTFDPLSVAPTFVNDNVKPVVRGGAGLTRGGASSVNDKTTIDKTLRIGSAKNKNKSTGLNVPT